MTRRLNVTSDLSDVAYVTDAVNALTERPIDLLIETRGAEAVQQNVNLLTAAWLMLSREKDRAAAGEMTAAKFATARRR